MAKPLNERDMARLILAAHRLDEAIKAKLTPDAFREITDEVLELRKALDTEQKHFPGRILGLGFWPHILTVEERRIVYERDRVAYFVAVPPAKGGDHGEWLARPASDPKCRQGSGDTRGDASAHDLPNRRRDT